MNQVELDSQEMKNFLRHMVSNNRFIQGKGLKPVSTEIIGESGLGKTSIALQLAEELDLNYVKLNLAQIEELGDLVGFPVRQFELCKAVEESKAEAPATPGPSKMVMTKDANGNSKLVKTPVETVVEKGPSGDSCVWVDENAVEEYMKRGYEFTGNKRMSYCPPEWIADKQGGGFLILDDWNRADIRFIQAVMELVDRQEYISWKLPEDWHIILTANPDNGNYLVNAIDVAQRTRFVSATIKWSAERWAEWAETQGIDGRCINFVLMNPEIVSDSLNPRSMTTFFNCISSFKSFDEELPMIQMIGEGSIGPEAASLFTTFIKNKLDRLITPKQMLLDKDTAVVINLIKDNLTDNGEYRADIASVLTTRLTNFAVTYSESNPITDEIMGRIATLIKTEDLFTDDLKFIIAKKVVAGNKRKFQSLINDPVIQDYVTK